MRLPLRFFEVIVSPIALAGLVATALALATVHSVHASCSTATFAADGSYSTGSDPVAVVGGDFNGDGRLDLAVANQASNNVSILLGDGAGGFGEPTQVATASAPVAVLTADFNGDGKPDLAIANQGANVVTVLLGKGDATFGIASRR